MKRHVVGLFIFLLTFAVGVSMVSSRVFFDFEEVDEKSHCSLTPPDVNPFSGEARVASDSIKPPA